MHIELREQGYNYYMKADNRFTKATYAIMEQLLNVEDLDVEEFSEEDLLSEEELIEEEISEEDVLSEEDLVSEEEDGQEDEDPEA